MISPNDRNIRQKPWTRTSTVIFALFCLVIFGVFVWMAFDVNDTFYLQFIPIDYAIGRLKSSNWESRAHAATALAARGDIEAMEPLMACLNDSDERVRHAAGDALDSLADKCSDRATLSRKAVEKVDECKDLVFNHSVCSGKILVLNLNGLTQHRASQYLDRLTRYYQGDGPVTVFLVTDPGTVKVGTYKISGEPGYSRCIEVYAVKFSRLEDSGRALGVHQILLNPRGERPVEYSPEFPDTALPVADYIKSLPIE